MTNPGHKHRIVPLEVGSQDKRRQRRSGLKYRRWTLRDLEYLRTVYPLLSQSEIAESLQVTKPAVDAIMRRWKITKL